MSTFEEAATVTAEKKATQEESVKGTFEEAVSVKKKRRKKSRLRALLK